MGHKKPGKSWNSSEGHGKSWKSNVLLEIKRQKDKRVEKITDASATAINFSRTTSRHKHAFYAL